MKGLIRNTFKGFLLGLYIVAMLYYNEADIRTYFWLLVASPFVFIAIYWKNFNV